MSMRTFGLAAAGAGLCVVGYCIYFDRKRRSDPQYKQKIRERRRLTNKSSGSGTTTKFPDVENPQAMQQFFLQQIQLGEELLARGEMTEGVEHLANAVAVCGQPQQLLQVLQQTLPPQVFSLLIQRLPAVTKRLSSSMAKSSGKTSAAQETCRFTEEDVE